MHELYESIPHVDMRTELISLDRIKLTKKAQSQLHDRLSRECAQETRRSLSIAASFTDNSAVNIDLADDVTAKMQYYGQTRKASKAVKIWKKATSLKRMIAKSEREDQKRRSGQMEVEKLRGVVG
jgi:hypothetical protein